MANKRNGSNSYKPNNGYQSSHSKGTRIFILVLAFLMIASILATMIYFLVHEIAGDSHDGHDHETGTTSSSTPTSSGTNSSASSTPASSGTTDTSKPASTGTSNGTTDTSK
ncbi:MAG: hypothetical protein J6B45_05900 [Clostridia bacterium]|nr:hypothetical protein [Clostridia bacterium]